MEAHPLAVYDVAGVRQLEKAACEDEGIASFELMLRAGAAAFSALTRRWPQARRVVVVCGSGSNGGDGYVLARLARADDREVVVIQVGNPSAEGDAALAWAALGAAQVPVERTFDALATADVVVDALFGIGLNRPLAGPAHAAVEAINAAACPCLSLDVPSGLNSETGVAAGIAVCAAVTVTFIAHKMGLLTGEACDYVGTLELETLGISSVVLNGLAPRAHRRCWADWPLIRRPRPRSAHKGRHGHVLIVGGAAGTGGAVRLAAEAALRTGAGLVSVATAPGMTGIVTGGRPEIMAHVVETPDDLVALLARASVVAVGPGLGQSAWAFDLWAAVRDCRQPLVVDADALNFLAADRSARPDWVLTPHPGEAARLLGVPNAGVIGRDRYGAVAELQRLYDGTVLLKGAGTLVQSASALTVIGGGNPGMATAGMGDVLTGVVAALIAQGHALPVAAAAGAALHAAAGDEAALAGERGLVAGDLMPCLRRLMN